MFLLIQKFAWPPCCYCWSYGNNTFECWLASCGMTFIPTLLETGLLVENMLVGHGYDDVLCTACRLSVGNHLLYLHMSSHYRRICNAKCTVDTSPPCVYKLNRSATRRWRHHISSHQSDISSCSPTDCELGLADIIANDTQQSPHTYLWVFDCFIWNIPMFYYRKVDFSLGRYGLVWYLKIGQDHHSLTCCNFSFGAVHTYIHAFHGSKKVVRLTIGCGISHKLQNVQMSTIWNIN
jgi:hypothetical protein